MLGFNPRELDAKKSKKNTGGRISGPGTATSDSIQTDVPEGSYIMPADSTEQIGEEALQGMGDQVPVNVSDGEYAMPPEQVHAVGVEALEQMKQQTNIPTGQPQVQQGQGFEPEMYFADGGVVTSMDDDEKKRAAAAQGAASQPPTLGQVANAAPGTAKVGPFNVSHLPNYGPAEQTPEQQAPAQAMANPEQPTLGQVANAGPGTAKLGPFNVSHLPDYSANKASPQAAQPAAEGFSPEQAQADPNQASFAQVANGGAGTAKVGPFNFTHLPSYGNKAQQQQEQMPAQQLPQQQMQQLQQPQAAGFEPEQNQAQALPPGQAMVPTPIQPNSSAMDYASSSIQNPNQPRQPALDQAQQMFEQMPKGQVQQQQQPQSFGDRLAQPWEGTRAVWNGGNQDMAESFADGRYGKGIGQGIRAGLALPVGVVDDFQKGFRKAVSPVSDEVVDAWDATVGNTDRVEVAKQQVAEQAKATKASQESAKKEKPDTATDSSKKETKKEEAVGEEEPPTGLANNVTRKGNSFSADGPIRSGYTVNGKATGGQNDAIQSKQNKQAVDNLMDRTAKFGAGAKSQQPGAGMGFNQDGKTRVTVVGDTSRQERDYNKAFNAASTAHRGAQNGQLTASQMNVMRGLMSDRHGTADNQRTNDTSLQREGMSQQGANARAYMQDQTAGQRNNLDERRLTGEEEVRGFQTRQSARLEDMRERFASAPPEEQSQIAEQLKILEGKDQADRFTAMSGGQVWDKDAMAMVNLPPVVLNTRTGQVNGGQQNQLPPIRQNPAVQEIMANTKLSAAEREKQIRALGYQ